MNIEKAFTFISASIYFVFILLYQPGTLYIIEERKTINFSRSSVIYMSLVFSKQSFQDADKNNM